MILGGRDPNSCIWRAQSQKPSSIGSVTLYCLGARKTSLVNLSLASRQSAARSFARKTEAAPNTRMAYYRATGSLPGHDHVAAQLHAPFLRRPVPASRMRKDVIMREMGRAVPRFAAHQSPM